MVNNNFVIAEKGWFCDSGPEEDVVISSKVRLSRNIDGFLFPEMMKSLDFVDFSKKINSAVKTMENYRFYNLNQLKLQEKQILAERFYIKAGADFGGERLILISEDEQVAAVFNDRDHIRIKSIKSGLDIRNAYNCCNMLDNLFEEKINYSFSLKYGYMTSDLVSSGTGMNVSVMVFIPALVRTGKIEKIFTEILKSGFSVRGFVAEKGDESAGDMYIINNQFSIGKSEEEIILELENITALVADNERKVRDMIFKSDRLDMEDDIFRSLGILSHCRKITLDDAVKFISLLKLGKYYNLLDNNITYSKLNCLLMQIQKSHVKKEDKNMNDDVIRADLIKNALFT